MSQQENSNIQNCQYPTVCHLWMQRDVCCWSQIWHTIGGFDLRTHYTNGSNGGFLTLNRISQSHWEIGKSTQILTTFCFWRFRIKFPKWFRSWVKYQKYFLKIAEKHDLTKMFAVYCNFTKNAIFYLQLKEPFKNSNQKRHQANR